VIPCVYSAIFEKGLSEKMSKGGRKHDIGRPEFSWGEFSRVLTIEVSLVSGGGRIL
jgi:hypothetical protein